MNIIKISVLSKNEFSEYYEYKKYKINPKDKLTIRRYAINNQKIIVDEGKANE